MKTKSMIRFVIPMLLFLVLITTNCSKKTKATVVKPTNLIEKSELSKILFDVYIIEAVIYFNGQKGLDFTLHTTAYYNNLFKKHKITKKQFFESMTYYLETDEDASSLFLDVINQLMSMQKTTLSGDQSQANQTNQQTQPSENDTVVGDPIFKNSRKK